MNKLVCLLDCKKLPCNPILKVLFGELGEAFMSYGFKYVTITELKTLPDYCIILLSDSKLDINIMNQLYRQAPNSVFIGWFFHKIYSDIMSTGMKFILTSEYFQEKPADLPQSHLKYWNLHQYIKNYVPFKLMANEDIYDVGTYEKEIKYNCCYIGWPYKRDWLDGLEKNFTHFTHDPSQFISFKERRNVYLQSIIAPGFQSDGNILNHHVSQRVYEGLCYGCVVISEHPTAHKMTNGIVEYAANKEEFQNKVKYFLSHPEECEKKRIAGYDWIKKNGTNRLVVLEFIRKIKELWDIDLIYAEGT
jgi:hypothetical protein